MTHSTKRVITGIARREHGGDAVKGAVTRKMRRIQAANIARGVKRGRSV